MFYKVVDFKAGETVAYKGPVLSGSVTSNGRGFVFTTPILLKPGTIGTIESFHLNEEVTLSFQIRGPKGLLDFSVTTSVNYIEAPENLAARVLTA